MNYYHSKIIHPYLFTPSFIGVNSDFSKSLMLQNGFSSDQVIKIEAQRFNYILKNKNKIILQIKIKKIYINNYLNY